MVIRQHKDPVLFQTAREVEDSEFGPELDALLSEMAVTMFAARGVGLAGPQVGESRRILVADLGYVNGHDYGALFVKMVNPKIVEFSSEKVVAEEGCLSYPGLEVNVECPKW